MNATHGEKGGHYCRHLLPDFKAQTLGRSTGHQLLKEEDSVISEIMRAWRSHRQGHVMCLLSVSLGLRTPRKQLGLVLSSAQPFRIHVRRWMLGGTICLSLCSHCLVRDDLQFSNPNKMNRYDEVITYIWKL